jgi:hypothetical protein
MLPAAAPIALMVFTAAPFGPNAPWVFCWQTGSVFVQAGPNAMPFSQHCWNAVPPRLGSMSKLPVVSSRQ